jgi:hypothetical protein
LAVLQLIPKNQTVFKAEAKHWYLDFLVCILNIVESLWDIVEDDYRLCTGLLRVFEFVEEQAGSSLNVGSLSFEEVGWEFLTAVPVLHTDFEIAQELFGGEFARCFGKRNLTQSELEGARFDKSVVKRGNTQGILCHSR